jgi:hypothetical protein
MYYVTEFVAVLLFCKENFNTSDLPYPPGRLLVFRSYQPKRAFSGGKWFIIDLIGQQYYIICKLGIQFR